MRSLTPLSMYNRKATMSPASPDTLGKSALALLAAGESKLLAMFLRLSNCGDPWEVKS